MDICGVRQDATQFLVNYSLVLRSVGLSSSCWPRALLTCIPRAINTRTNPHAR